MGCINSSTTKGLNELRSSAVGGVVHSTGGAGLDGIGAFYDNVYRVRAVRLVSEGTGDQNGFLELTPREILFVPLSDNEYPTSMVWNLQHLRRYGASGDTFSFEAGRRCMSGAGVFTFQLEEAEVLYRLFQRYINTVGTQPEDMPYLQSHNASEHPSNTLGRLHVNTNNYLHPSLAQRAAAAACTANCENASSMRLDSPDSPSINSNANEAVLFSHNSRYTPTEQLAGNIYSERPLSSCNEPNNNINSFMGMNNNDQSELSICGESGTASAFSTISRKLLIPRSSQDNTNNSQTMTPTTPLRLYANVDHWTDFSTSNNSDSCYENVRGADFPVLFPPITPVATSCVPTTGGSNPTTPGATVTATLTRLASIVDPESMSLGSGGEASTQGASLVNYIVLDLDQPRSPVTICSQYSPKTPFGSEFSISAANTEADECSQAITTTTNSIAAVSTNVTTFTTSNMTTTTTTSTQIERTETEEQQLDYSTIDFVKTWALIESSTDGVDFDADPDPDTAEEELRITRHSKCVRKAYSISE